ncbi:MAG TPA: NAD(P)H-binding protein [Bacteroidales bacterium]|jgi:uncharacterized protein YbjT (DUF2867 family)|nr:NAD(P)H-binding protein [Bacteroidales bacterium]
MKRSAVVFGASGLVGTELIKELKSNDSFEKITAVVRSELDLHYPKINQVILTDYDNLSDHVRKLTATDYFCCIGTTIKTAKSKEAFQKVDYGIPVQIATLASQLNIPNLVVVSSIGANANSRNFYLRTKGEMENAVRKVFKGNLKFLRPSLLIGKRNEHRAGEKAAVIFMKTLGWIFSGPIKKYKGISARTVAKAMILATTLPPDKIYLEGDDLFNASSDRA